MDFLLPVAQGTLGYENVFWRRHWREVRKSDIVVIAEPEDAEPLSLSDAKAHLNITGTDSDTWLNRAIPACRRQVETDLGWALVDATLEMLFDGFPVDRWIEVRGRLDNTEPVTITSYDINDVPTVMDPSTFIVDDHSKVARVILKTAQVWPNGLRLMLAGKIQWSVVASEIPDRAIQAICLLLGHWNENREAVTSGTNRYTPDQYPLGYDACLSDRVMALG